MKTQTPFKTLFLLVLLVAAGKTTVGQQLPLIGSDVQWTYWFPEAFSPTIYPRNFALHSDTLVDGLTFYKSDFQLFDEDGGMHPIYIAEDSSGMYFYDNISHEPRILYDYSLSDGESYVILPLLGSTADSLVVRVDSVKMEHYNGEAFRTQYISTHSISHANRPNHWAFNVRSPEREKIIEHLGGISFLFPQEIAWHDNISIGLCSFSQTEWFYQSNDTVSCDSPIDLSSAQEYIDESKDYFKIYPNPTCTFCNLVNDSKEECSCVVMDVAGKTLLKCQVPAHETREINVEHCKCGVYYVIFRTMKAMYVSKLFVL